MTHAGDDAEEDALEAEERRALEEALIAERNAAQHAAEDDGSQERILLMPPEGYAVPPDADPDADEEE